MLASPAHQQKRKVCASTAWCSEIGSLTSLDACNSGASSDIREPISLHQAVHVLPWRKKNGHYDYA